MADNSRVYRALCKLIKDIDLMIDGTDDDWTIGMLTVIQDRLKEVLKLL
jgi:hypothetical protein